MKNCWSKREKILIFWVNAEACRTENSSSCHQTKLQKLATHKAADIMMSNKDTLSLEINYELLRE